MLFQVLSLNNFKVAETEMISKERKRFRTILPWVVGVLFLRSRPLARKAECALNAVGSNFIGVLKNGLNDTGTLLFGSFGK